MDDLWRMMHLLGDFGSISLAACAILQFIQHFSYCVGNGLVSYYIYKKQKAFFCHFGSWWGHCLLCRLPGGETIRSFSINFQQIETTKFVFELWHLMPDQLCVVFANKGNIEAQSMLILSRFQSHFGWVVRWMKRDKIASIVGLLLISSFAGIPHTKHIRHPTWIYGTDQRFVLAIFLFFLSKFRNRNRSILWKVRC